jgi:hypothetical protein
MWYLPRADLAARAEDGELVPLGLKGGVQKKLKGHAVKHGTLHYLAAWQGLRGEDLDVDLLRETLIVCSKTGQAVLFSAQLPLEEDVEGSVDESGEDEDVAPKAARSPSLAT